MKCSLLHIIYSARAFNKCIVIIAILFNCLPVIAQQNINFTSLNSNDGLSSNTINAILKDHYGLMWFATDDGLNKFDGSRFTVYRNRSNDTTSLQANEILSLHEDQKGNLWVGTGGGAVSLYDRKKDNFINFSASEGPKSLHSNVVKSICNDADGNIWAACYEGISIIHPATLAVSDFIYNGHERFNKKTICILADSKNRIWIGTIEGLYVFDRKKGKLSFYTHDPGNDHSLSGYEVHSITEDKMGNMWIGTDAGLSRTNANLQGFVNYIPQDNGKNTIGKGRVQTLAAGDDGKLWIGTAAGLDILDINSGAITNITYNSRLSQGLTGNAVQFIYIDKQHIYWIGTVFGGIDKYDRNLSLFNHVQGNPFDEKALPSPMVTAFAEVNKGQIFVGTQKGGLSVFDPSSRSFKRLALRSRLTGKTDGLDIIALQKTRSNQLAAGVFGDGLFIINPQSGSYKQLVSGNDANSIGSNHIFCLTEDRAGQLWIGTNGSGITVLNDKQQVVARYTPTPRFANDILLPLNPYIRDIIEDKNGDYWIATHGGGVAKLNKATSKFRIYTNRNSGLPNNKVQCVIEDKQGNIWVGSLGDGLGLLDKKTNRFTSFAEKDGLINNNIHKIVADSQGKLWISTNQGISSFDPQKKKFSNYNAYNGVQQNDFLHGAGMKAANGDIYFGGLQGFNYFNPADLKKNTNIPDVILTDLRISNRHVIPGKDEPISENISVATEINLDYRQNFALSFVGLNYTAPEQNQYAYKLEGFDKDWNYTGNTNTASYTNLDPGEYVFRVKASNNDGLWNNEGSFINITVHPPFWRTTYAYIFYALAIIAILMYSRYKGIQRVKLAFEKKQEKMQIEQERKDAERIRELDSQKIKFLTNLSHEFRTPLSLIMSPIDSLISSEHSEQSFGQLHIIKRNARRLLNLVNQLLDFRKMEENELKLHPTVGEFIAFARETTDSFRDLAERKKIRLVFDNHISCLDIKFDHDKNERILFNLLSNAFKFTLEGGCITLQIKRCENNPVEEGRTWLCIKVCDTGVGVPADKKEKIFENFFQVTTEASILNQGTGIGLSITKEFVRMQGGTIRAESEVGKGSAFIMELPFENVELPTKELMPFTEETTVEEEIIASPFAGNRKNKSHEALSIQPSVLLVEDNDDFRLYLKDILRTHYKIYEASNGKEGWQKALAEHPQIIVSDISMPYMDGIELCKKIKADKRTNHIPVILLTALADDQHQLKGLEYGANDYITKPFNCEMLNAKVRNLLTLNDNFKNTYLKQLKVLTPETVIESEDEKLLSEIMAYLEEHLTDTQLSVEGLSRHIGMSRSSLYTKILELTGETPVEFIRSVKLDKAAILLEKSDMNIAQIAYSVGFATPNYFAKSFKTKFSMLPSEYISKMRNK